MTILGTVSIFCYCTTFKSSLSGIQNRYMIKSIDSINNWYIVYASRKDSMYKIVTAKTSEGLKCTQKIIINNYYNLKLYSRKENAPVINGVKVAPTNSLDIQCYAFDEATNICVEPKKNIYDWYMTSNIRGLCYHE